MTHSDQQPFPMVDSGDFDSSAFRKHKVVHLKNEIDEAFDYRGDVTLTLNTEEKLDGFLFNRVWGKRPYVELMLSGQEETMTIPIQNIVTIECTGKDAAHGKSWETWMENQQKARQDGTLKEGEILELFPDPLDE